MFITGVKIMAGMGQIGHQTCKQLVVMSPPLINFIWLYFRQMKVMF